MPKASEIKKNAAVEMNGEAYIVRDIERSVPQGRAGGSLYRMRMYNVATNHKIDETFKDSDMLSLADLDRRPVTFSYADGDEYVFMDSEDYSSYSLDKESIADELLFMAEDAQGLLVVMVNEAP
ncbi:elongation factor P-like protein YeiP, partial [Oleiphilus sp. HI0061]